MYEGQPRIAYHQTFVARSRYLYDRKHRQLHDVNEPLFSTTPCASPQLELIELDDEQWRKFQPDSLNFSPFVGGSSGQSTRHIHPSSLCA